MCEGIGESEMEYQNEADEETKGVDSRDNAN